MQSGSLPCSTTDSGLYRPFPVIHGASACGSTASPNRPLVHIAAFQEQKRDLAAVRRGEGWQSQRDSGTVIDAAGRDRLAHAPKDMAPIEYWVGPNISANQCFSIHLLAAITYNRAMLDALKSLPEAPVACSNACWITRSIASMNSCRGTTRSNVLTLLDPAEATESERRCP